LRSYLASWDTRLPRVQDAGKHARSAVGMAGLPGNQPVEVELIVEVE
jgi:enamine deaminase RidA (YjgF/YER057c/UK114 family)